MHPLTDTIDSSARSVIDRYLALPVGTHPSCPYFNNRRRRTRAGLRALKGKGTPEEISEEASLRGLQEKTPINELAPEILKEFLVDNDLGIDCSGFAYHVLSALVLSKTSKSLSRLLHFDRPGILGSLIAHLRPAENAGVSAFRMEQNSTVVEAQHVRPGDIIVLMGTGKDKTYNHMMVITSVTKMGDAVDLSYAHSYAWPTDGVYGHGVREGHISYRGNNLMEGTWNEHGATGTENFTLTSARDAHEISVRRLRFLE